MNVISRYRKGECMTTRTTRHLRTKYLIILMKKRKIDSLNMSQTFSFQVRDNWRTDKIIILYYVRQWNPFLAECHRERFILWRLPFLDPMNLHRRVNNLQTNWINEDLQFVVGIPVDANTLAHIITKKEV